jgi:hypothetical protein
MFCTRERGIVRTYNKSHLLGNNDIASREQIWSTRGTRILARGTNVVYSRNKNGACEEQISSTREQEYYVQKYISLTRETKILCPKNTSHLRKEEKKYCFGGSQS